MKGWLLEAALDAGMWQRANRYATEAAAMQAWRALSLRLAAAEWRLVRPDGSYIYPEDA